MVLSYSGYVILFECSDSKRNLEDVPGAAAAIFDTKHEQLKRSDKNGKE